MTEPETSWPWVLSAPTLWQLVTDRAARSPDAVQIVDEHGETLTCRQFRDRAERVAAALAELGIGPGTRVAWQLPTRISTLLVLVALRRLGAVQAPIIPLYRDREVAAALRTSDVQVWLIPGVWGGFDFAAMAERIASSGGPAPRVVTVGHRAAESDDVAGLPTPETDPDAERWIYFTSGSSGLPKGARHTDDTLLAAARAFSGIGRVGRVGHEVMGMAFPVAHIGGVAFLSSAMSSGATVVVLEAFVPARAVEVFGAAGVTITGGAPPFYSAFLAMARADPGAPPLPSLRMFMGGGAPCPPELAMSVHGELGVIVAHDYGMTEIVFIGIGCPDDPLDVLARTDGRISPFVSVRLVDADGHEVPAGEPGEVLLSGRTVCRGYTDAEETAAAFTADGWFRTGDLARIHPGGQIEVVGRVKDLIIRKGENVSPQEIEQELGRHRAVAEVTVIGLPDSERGERVCAVIVPAGDAMPTLAELNEWLLGAGLMRQKLPEQLEIVDELPRTGLAKVAKAELRRRFGETRQ